LNAIEQAVVRTVLYGDLFHFAMTPEEIHHFLIADHPYSLHDVTTTLADSSALANLLEQHDGYVMRKDSPQHAALRRQREASRCATPPAPAMISIM
jgi:hypothetical protein